MDTYAYRYIDVVTCRDFKIFAENRIEFAREFNSRTAVRNVVVVVVVGVVGVGVGVVGVGVVVVVVGVGVGVGVVVVVVVGVGVGVGVVAVVVVACAAASGQGAVSGQRSKRFVKGLEAVQKMCMCG